MSLPYNLAKTDRGSYLFTTDRGLVYTVFFTSYDIEDEERNRHTVYNFGFDRGGTFTAGKFQHEFDERIKATIVSIIKEFFQKNDSKALLYFCYSDDEYSRHRAIIFGRWCREEMSDEIEHLKKTAVLNNERLHGGMLILKSNPLRDLLVGAISNYMSDSLNYK